MNIWRTADWLQKNKPITNMKPVKTECMNLEDGSEAERKRSHSIQYRYTTLSNTEAYKYQCKNTSSSAFAFQTFCYTFQKAA